MKTVFLWEILRRKMFTVWWAVGISGLIAMTVLSYLAIKDQAQTLDQTFGDLSASAGSFFGGNDLFSPIGYLSSQIYFILLPLMIIIMAVTLSSSLMKKDESDATIELVLSRPVSRTRVLLGKVLAGLTIMAVVGIVSYVVTTLCVAIAGLPINQNNLLITHLLCFLFAGSFGAISFALIAVSRHTRGIASVVAILLSLGGYVLTSLSGFVKDLEPLSKALPYHYYNTVDLLGGKVDGGLIIYIVGVYILAGIVMWIGYTRRDIG
jgi:ABC-2 type transport system permease protein